MEGGFVLILYSLFSAGWCVNININDYVTDYVHKETDYQYVWLTLGSICGIVIIWQIILYNVTLTCKNCGFRFFITASSSRTVDGETKQIYVVNHVEQTASLHEANYIDEIFECPKCATDHTVPTKKSTTFKPCGEDFPIETCKHCKGNGYNVIAKIDWDGLRDTAMFISDDPIQLAAAAMPKDKKIPCMNCDKRGWIKL